MQNRFIKRSADSSCRGGCREVKFKGIHECNHKKMCSFGKAIYNLHNLNLVLIAKSFVFSEMLTKNYFCLDLLGFPVVEPMARKYEVLNLSDALNCMKNIFIVKIKGLTPSLSFRNPSLKQQLFSYAILGFALSEAMGLFCLMVAFLILFAM